MFKNIWITGLTMISSTMMLELSHNGETLMLKVVIPRHLSSQQKCVCVYAAYMKVRALISLWKQQQVDCGKGHVWYMKNYKNYLFVKLTSTEVLMWAVLLAVRACISQRSSERPKRHICGWLKVCVWKGELCLWNIWSFSEAPVGRAMLLTDVEVEGALPDMDFKW